MPPIIKLSHILALTPVDYQHLAKAVQVEAAMGTFDEYCVAVSILNRVRSPKYPNTVKEVVYAPGQYEGLFTKNPAPKQELVDRLQSKDGRLGLMSAFAIIRDRTDFKGQSMLKYRVPSEDPMCHPKGNFYHYYWQ